MTDITERLQEEIGQAAEEYLKDPQISYLPFTGFQDYLEKGERLSYENCYFARRRQLAVLALSYSFEPDETKKELLEQVIWEVCNEYTWALPAHLPVTGQEFGSASPVWIDLFASETGQTLGEILELAGDQLTPMIYQRVIHEIDRRIFQPFEAQPWAWEHKDNNWSAVVGGCVGMAALSVLPKNSRRQKHIIQRLDTAMQSYLSGFGDDGACVEGVGYWGYGFGYYIYFAKKLADVLGDWRYLEADKVKKIAAFPYYAMIKREDYLPFSDYAQPDLPSGLVSFCHDYFHVPVPTMKGASGLDFDHCYRFAQLSRNLSWTSRSILEEHKEDVAHYFQDAQWLAIRSPKQKFVFAGKGGNNEESHNHLDIGHFILGNGKTLYLTDMGAGEYTRDYFTDEKRYDYLVNSALGHSLPMVNRTFQQAGPVRGEKVSWQDRIFSLDLTGTYPEEAGLTSFVRRFEIDQAKRQVVLTDDFIFSQEKNRITENFITKIRPEIDGTMVKLCADECLKLEFSASEIEVIRKGYRSHSGAEEEVYLVQVRYEFGRRGSAGVRMGF